MTRRVVLLAVLVAITLPSASLAAASVTDNWPQYRGPDGDGHSASKGLPLTWSETNHVKWKTPIHGRAWSSPVVWGDQIWLTTATEDGRDLFAVCLDQKSGKIVHDLKLFTVILFRIGLIRC